MTMKLLARCITLLAATALIVGLLVGMSGLASAVPPPTSVSSGAAPVSGVNVNGSGNNYALVSPTAHVTLAGNYAVNDTGCPLCSDQIEIGWAGSSAPVACIYSGVAIGNGSFTQDLGPAPNPGVNEVIINFAQDFACNPTHWWSSNAGPSIAEVAVSPPNSGSKGNASVSGVTVNGGPGNSVVTPAGSSVTVAGNYLMNAGCVGCGQQIQIGWAGSSAQFGCIYADGPHGSGTFTFNMLVPPSLGANYIVINATQNGGNNCTAGWSSSGPAIALAYVWPPPPTVTGVSPSTGPTTGGTTVNVTGTNLLNVSSVKFGTASAGFSCNNAGSLCSATAPAGTAGTVDVTVTTASGTSGLSPADQYTYVTPPAVTNVSPNQGPLTAGTPVTITGTNLSPATGVNFGANPATGVTCSATSCTVTAPAGVAGTVDVTVTTTGGGTSAINANDKYTYVPLPTVTSISPTAGPLGAGTSVTINGANLNPSSSPATTVKFGANPASGVSCNVGGTSCTVTAPAGAAGVVDVTVTTVGGTSATSPADQYTYTPAPTVTGILPVGGSFNGGTSVTITGTNLGPTTSIHFGATLAPGFTCSATQCTVNSPAGAPASVVDVTVTTPGGTSPTSPADLFTYTAGAEAPFVKGISPNSGPSTGGTVITITGQGFAGATEVDFGDPPATNVSCTPTQCTATSPPGTGTVAVTVKGPGGTSVLSPADQFTYTGTNPFPPFPPFSNGYWLVASDGGIFAFGGSQFFGSTGNQPLNKPVVGMASTPDGQGYWLVASDGGIFAFGDAGFFGSTGAMTLNKPVVGMDFSSGGGGYWLVASDGGIFSFGNAQFFGSTGAQKLNSPIVGMLSTPDGQGYWLVAADGGTFAFGDASYFGSTGAQKLNSPIVAMASTPDGGGYWLVAADGGIFSFGDAAFFGSTGAQKLNKPIVAMASTPDGGGYWLVASDGGIFSFGDAPFMGSTGAQTLNQPIVGMSTRF
jgi:hypothetical protein